MERQLKKSSRITFKYILELASAASGISFIISALIYEAVFIFRGFANSFLELASIEDVVIGGLQLLVDFIIAIPISTAFIFMISVVISNFSDGKYFRRSIVKRYIFVTMVSLIASTHDIFKSMVLYDPRIFKAFFVFFLITIVMSSIGLIRTLMVIRKRRCKYFFGSLALASRLYGNRIILTYYSLIPTIFITAAAFASITTWQRVSFDFLEGVGVLIGESSKLVPCGDHRVLWLGSSNAIIRCNDNTIVAIRGIENLSLDVDR